MATSEESISVVYDNDAVVSAVYEAATIDINNLDARVTELENELETIKADNIDDLYARVTELESELETIKADITITLPQIDDLCARVTEIENKLEAIEADNLDARVTELEGKCEGIEMDDGSLILSVPASTTKSFTASSGITIGSTAISSSDAAHIASLNRRCNFGPDTSPYTNQWYKFASCTLPNTNEDRKLILLVSLAFTVNSSAGILVATVRSQTGSDVPIYPRLSWLAMESSNTISLQPNNWVMAYSTTAPFTIELWYKATSAWHTWSAVVLDDSNRTTPGQYWTLYDNRTGSPSVTSGYAQVTSTYDPPVKIATVTAAINKTSDQLIGSVTAPTVSDYTFLTWIQFSSNGYIGSPYPQYANEATTSIYDIHGASATSSCSVFCVAMYTRNY